MSKKEVFQQYNMNSDHTPHLFRVNFFFNDKVLLLTVPKIAHSTSEKLFGYDVGKIVSAIDVNKVTFSLIFNEKELRDDYFIEVEKIWNNFLEKKEKRDLVILYRDPYEHFISGFMQDWIIKNITPITYPYFIYFINSLPGTIIEKNNFIKDFKNSQNGLTPKLISKYKDISSELIKMNFDFYIKNANYAMGHYTPWLSFVQNLYYSNKIDVNKIKFFDIYEAPLEIQLKNYLENVNTSIENLEYYKQNNYAFDMIKRMIETDVVFRATKNSIIGNEMVVYNKIKNKEL